jgi:hypothetical protein
MGTGDLLALMQQFDPQKQQQEQLQLQVLAQQLALGQAQEGRQAEIHAAAQARAQQLDPLNFAIQQALVNRIPAQDEAAQAAAAAARLGQEQAEFTLGQQRTNAPIQSANLQAQLAASLYGPQAQQEQTAIQRQAAENQAAHYASQDAAAKQKADAERLNVVLNAAAAGLPGVKIAPGMLGEASGGLLQPAGTVPAFNAAVAQQGPAAGQEYVTNNPEVTKMEGYDPKVLSILAASAAAGTGAEAPGAIPMAPPPEPVSNWTWMAGPPGYSVGKLANWMGHNRGFTEYERQRRTVK